MKFIAKSITVVLSITACSISGYFAYLLLHKREDDDYFDTFASACNLKVHRIIVPKDMVAALIGRNGANVKHIEQQSCTQINFEDYTGTDESSCTIRGSVEACNIAENLIREFIKDQPQMVTEDMWVPNNCIGKIIGRNGEKISEIISTSGVKINVSDNENTVTSKRIMLKGTNEQIFVAKSLIANIIDEVFEFQQRIDASLSKREPRIPSKSPEALKRVESPRCERISPIPGQPDAQFEVYISAMVDPSRFWLQIVGPKATELDCLVEEMTEYYNIQENRNLHVLYDVKKGDLVAAVFKYDNKWYRAEVLNVIEENSSEIQAELYFVDYGDTDTLSISEIYSLRTDFLQLHFQAIECFLARVEPVGDSWSEEAIDKFEERTHVAQWKKLSAKINGYCHREKIRATGESSPIPGVDLFEINSDGDIDVAEELVKTGLAVFKKDAHLRSNGRVASVSNISVASSS